MTNLNTSANQAGNVAKPTTNRVLILGATGGFGAHAEKSGHSSGMDCW